MLCPYFEAVTGELLGVGGGQNLVAFNGGVHDLGYAVPVGKADHQAVLRRVVLVLVLGDHALAGTVVRFAL